MPEEDLNQWLEDIGFGQFAEALERLGIEQVPDVQDLDWDDLVMLVGMSTDDATVLMDQADEWVEQEVRYVEYTEREEQSQLTRRNSAHKLKLVRRISFRYASEDAAMQAAAQAAAQAASRRAVVASSAGGSESEGEDEGEDECPVIDGEAALASLDTELLATELNLERQGQLLPIDIDVDEQHDLALQLLLCPITMEIMVDPVAVLVDGQVYDRDSIEDWLSMGYHTSPVSGEPMRTPSRLPVYGEGLPLFVPNHALRNVIEDSLRKDPTLIHCFSNLAVPSNGIVECKSTLRHSTRHSHASTVTACSVFVAEASSSMLDEKFKNESELAGYCALTGSLNELKVWNLRTKQCVRSISHSNKGQVVSGCQVGWVNAISVFYLPLPKPQAADDPNRAAAAAAAAGIAGASDKGGSRDDVSDSDEDSDNAVDDLVPFAMVAHRIEPYTHVLKVWSLSQTALTADREPHAIAEFHGHMNSVTCCATFDARCVLSALRVPHILSVVTSPSPTACSAGPTCSASSWSCSWWLSQTTQRS
jgi:hypothetical protein